MAVKAPTPIPASYTARGIITPDRLIMEAPGTPASVCLAAAEHAVVHARRIAPKCSGLSALRYQATWGEGWFGVRWLDNHTWFQEMGIRPFTMKNLEGKTIPMWIDDPTGVERQRNPKAERRVTASGKIQVLIFRRAAKRGERKMVTRRVHGVERLVSVPKSYPGAPGRISRRQAAAPWTTEGKVGGQIAHGNVGVRWRHPGLTPRFFIRHSMEQAAATIGINIGTVYGSLG